MVTEAELDAQADMMLEAEVARRRAQLRADLAAKERHRAAMAHLDEVERRGRERMAAEDAAEPARQRAMDEEKARARAKWAATEQRWAEQAAAEAEREKKARSRLPRMRTGPEGFEIRRR